VATGRLTFTGEWQSCLSQNFFLSGLTNGAVPGRPEGPPVSVDVSGCNSAALDVQFLNAGTPEPGCVSVVFTSSDRPDIEQCGEDVQIEIDF
jgi:hypothetical protein